MKLGNKILELRKEKRLSQEQLAEKINVTRQTISNWELGETSPDLNQAKELAKVLNISLDECVSYLKKLSILDEKIKTGKIDKKVGFGPKYIDYERKIQYPTAAKEAA